MHLGDHPRLSSRELARLTSLSETEVRRKMRFWVSTGVVREISSDRGLSSSNKGGYDSRSDDEVLYEVNENPPPGIGDGQDGDDDVLTEPYDEDSSAVNFLFSAHSFNRK